jgi:glycosyltransferase involved in cell wall biosynthesis
MSGHPLIALDARLIGYAAGIARYATLLAEALSNLDGPEQFVALRGRRGRQVRLGRMRWRTALTPPHHRLERLVLPLELMARQPWPDVLHSVDHVAPRWGWGAWKSVVTLHDLAFLLYPETHTDGSRAYYAATGDSVRRAQRVIAVSQRTASDAVRLLGIDPVRVRVVHEAAAPTYGPRSSESLPPLARRLGIDPGRPYILFVGTLEPRKNLVFLIEAFALLRRSLDVQLVLAGSRGWLDEPIFAAHARSGVGNAARFVGSLSEEDLAILYSHAAAFVLPSLYEGFGLPVLEAMACGAPVACSDAGPLPEVAGDAAVLLAPDDMRGWAETLGEIVTNPRLAQGLRARGFARSAEFSWQRTAEATRDVYREALLA